ncbi:MAG: hypothetical protein ACK5LT_11230 [Lachnospirales bacterium]
MFTSDAYAVVNNNVNNPMVIEFGKGVNEEIDTILDKNSDAIIVYCSPFEIFEKSYARSNTEVVPLLEQYSDLDNTNDELIDQFELQKNIYKEKLNESKQGGSGGYGFVDL